MIEFALILTFISLVK